MRFRWLHISDCHLKQDSAFGTQQALGAFLKCVEEESARGRFDAIFLTGDVAAHGKPDQYQRASELLDRLLEIAGVGPERVFVVPGNHDVDRARVRPYHRLMVESNQQAIDRLFACPRTLELLGEKFEGYAAFARAYPNAWRPGRRPYIATTFMHQGYRIGVASVNTAWLVDDRDSKERSLLAGRSVLKAALEQATEYPADIVFVAMHHPLSWLRDEEEPEIRALLHRHANLCLYGHLHRSEWFDVRSDQGRCAFLQAGALVEDAVPHKRFAVGSWNARSGAVTVSSYVLADEGIGARWTPDPKTARCTSIRPVKRGAAADVRMLVVGPKQRLGAMCDPVACVYIDAPPRVLEEIDAVRYVRVGTERLEWRSDSREDCFSQTIPVSAGCAVIATVLFKDGGEHELARIELGPRD
jgi:predicted phosphodiesterase